MDPERRERALAKKLGFKVVVLKASEHPVAILQYTDPIAGRPATLAERKMWELLTRRSLGVD